ncbi:MAG: DUF4399 domain-containing protein [Hyphomicrobiales bacterium]
MNRLAAALALTGVLFGNGPAHAGGTQRPANAELYIGWPNDGEVLRKPAVKVWFGLRNMGVAPAGIDAANAGHHHLIVDAGLPDSSEPIPNNENYLHFGKGQTEAVVTLSKGVHTLQLNFADKEHRQFDPPLYSRKITITVK